MIERARQHGLTGYPLIWTNSYDHYWMVFAHDAHAERVSWLADISGEQRMLRILELTKELNDVRSKYAKTKEKLAEANLELSKRRDDPLLVSPGPGERKGDRRGIGGLRIARLEQARW